MSLAEIEAELGKMTPDELRDLALKSWTAFVKKEAGPVNECSEDDSRVLAALDEAIEKADASPRRGYSAKEVRSQLSKWTSR
jgi:hypothetical protein